jgi:hypothetical protein
MHYSLFTYPIYLGHLKKHPTSTQVSQVSSSPPRLSDQNLCMHFSDPPVQYSSLPPTLPFNLLLRVSEECKL